MAAWSIDPLLSTSPARGGRAGSSGFEPAAAERAAALNVLDRRSVGPEIVVRLEYRLFDAEGALVEAPGPDEPIEFIFGSGQAPVHLEQAIEGLRRGESRRVRLSPDQAFGRRDEGAIVSVERSELPANAALGDELEAESEDGELVFLRVVDIDADSDTVTLDANHPLAGQTVSLELSVLELRVATREELSEARAALEALAPGEEPSVPDVLSHQLARRHRSEPPERS